MKVDVAASAGEAHPVESPHGEAPISATESRYSPGMIGVAIVVGAGLGLRFVAPPHLWLDEALTVNIAKLPLDQLRTALERDGGPPLFYVLLHGWMTIFGADDRAVRALSGILGAVAVGLAYVAGTKLGRTPSERRGLAVATMVVVATSPYAIRYSSEARMYSLVMALVFAGIAIASDLWTAPSMLRFVGLVVVTAGLLYAQYWTIFLIATVGIGLVAVVLCAGAPTRHSARRVLGGIIVGGVLFIPWIPTLRTQLVHTGTPWDAPAGLFASTWHSIVAFGGGRVPLGWFLTAILVTLAVVAVLGHRGELTRTARVVVTIGTATLGVAIVTSVIAASGVQDRYATVVFPFVALAAAVGIVTRHDPRFRALLLAGVAVAGLVTGLRSVREVRTAAGPIAHALVADVSAGDVVAYCPDQLGPSTARLVGARVDQVTFPRLAAPQFVDWTDYAARNAAGSPTRFARRIERRAGAGSIWFVWSPGYRTLGTKCEAVINALTAGGRQPSKVTVARGPNGERIEVRRFER